MTTEEFAQYKILLQTSYKDYVLDIRNRAQVSKLNLEYELDNKLWILRKAISVIFTFNFDGNNAYTTSEFLQWQDIMNDIMRTRRYVDFIIE